MSPRPSTPEEITKEDARTLALAVATARLDENADDVAALLSDYLGGAVGRGVSLSLAWTYLFSASTNWLTATIIALSAIHEQSPQAEVNDLALEYARVTAFDE